MMWIALVQGKIRKLRKTLHGNLESANQISEQDFAQYNIFKHSYAGLLNYMGSYRGGRRCLGA